MSGRFLVLEGIDCCGKTTQLRHLANWLPSSGLMHQGAKVHLTREPGGTALGLALRALLLDPPGEAVPEPLAELLLYAADRAQHVSTFIRPVIEQGDWVLSDRFSGSTIAYQGFGRLLDMKVIEQLEEIATRGVAPDLTLLLDLSVEKSLARRTSRVEAEDRIEAEGVEFLARVSSGFSYLAQNRNWAVVPADQPIENINRLIERILMQRFSI